MNFNASHEKAKDHFLPPTFFSAQLPCEVGRDENSLSHIYFGGQLNCLSILDNRSQILFLSTFEIKNVPVPEELRGYLSPSSSLRHQSDLVGRLSFSGSSSSISFEEKRCKSLGFVSNC